MNFTQEYLKKKKNKTRILFFLILGTVLELLDRKDDLNMKEDICNQLGKLPDLFHNKPLFLVLQAIEGTCSCADDIQTCLTFF